MSPPSSSGRMIWFSFLAQLFMLVDTRYLSSSSFFFLFSFPTLYGFFFELLLALGTRAICIFFLSFLSLSSNILWIVAIPRRLNKRAGLTVILEQPSLRLWIGQEHMFFLFITACVLYHLGLLVAFFFSFSPVWICICFFYCTHLPLYLSRGLFHFTHILGGLAICIFYLFFSFLRSIGLGFFFFLSIIFPFLF